MLPLAVRSLVVIAALGCVPATAQQARFRLPDPPFRYFRAASVDAPASELSLPPSNDPRADAQAALGRVLFYDPLLSRARTRSCASCHRQARAFSDGAARSIGFAGERTRRNSMPIVDLAKRRGGFFWDERAATLEEMVVMPIQDPVEMGLDLGTLVQRLQSEPGYSKLFADAFGDASVDRMRIAAALARFTRAIVSNRSKYDRGLTGAPAAHAPFPNFSAAENRGKALFFGPDDHSRSCARCHVAQQVLPCGCWAPDPSNLVPEFVHSNGLDDGRRSRDRGRGEVTGRPEDAGRFRSPSLRNVALTAPYMHDGRFATLRDVVDFYAAGVRDHPNLDATLGGATSSWGGHRRRPSLDAMQSIVSGERLGLPMSSRERADLVAFLETLTDYELVRDPRFADPFHGATIGRRTGLESP